MRKGVAVVVGVGDKINARNGVAVIRSDGVAVGVRRGVAVSLPICGVVTVCAAVRRSMETQPVCVFQLHSALVRSLL